MVRMKVRFWMCALVFALLPLAAVSAEERPPLELPDDVGNELFNCMNDAVREFDFVVQEDGNLRGYFNMNECHAMKCLRDALCDWEETQHVCAPVTADYSRRCVQGAFYW